MHGYELAAAGSGAAGEPPNALADLLGKVRTGDELGLAEEWIGKGNREDRTLPVLVVDLASPRTSRSCWEREEVSHPSVEPIWVFVEHEV